MSNHVRKGLLALGVTSAMAIFSLFTGNPAEAAASAHTVVDRPASPDATGFCYTHWLDLNGNRLPYATFTCLATGDSIWRGSAQCTNDTTYFTNRHTGAGNDQINCPGGDVVIYAGVTFLN